MDLGNNNYQMATNITKREISRHVPPGGVHGITYVIVLPEKEKEKENWMWLNLKIKLLIYRKYRGQMNMWNDASEMESARPRLWGNYKTKYPIVSTSEHCKGQLGIWGGGL